MLVCHHSEFIKFVEGIIFQRFELARPSFLQLSRLLLSPLIGPSTSFSSTRLTGTSGPDSYEDSVPARDQQVCSAPQRLKSASAEPVQCLWPPEMVTCFPSQLLPAFLSFELPVPGYGFHQTCCCREHLLYARGVFLTKRK